MILTMLKKKILRMCSSMTLMKKTKAKKKTLITLSTPTLLKAVKKKKRIQLLGSHSTTASSIL